MTSDLKPTQIPWHGWLWVPLGLLAMGFGAMHIFIDFGVALWDFTGTLSGTEVAMILGIALIQVWWALSFIAGTHGRVGGILSVAVLALVWTGLTNGSAIAFCAPVCKEGYPLTDVAHLGALIGGLVAGLAALWGAVVQWRQRAGVLWILPMGAVVLTVGTIVALANTPMP